MPERNERKEEKGEEGKERRISHSHRVSSAIAGSFVFYSLPLEERGPLQLKEQTLVKKYKFKRKAVH